MSIAKLVTIYCDTMEPSGSKGEGCHGTYANGDQGFMTATQQRKNARKDGWKQMGTKDICPYCLQVQTKKPNT